MGMSVYVCVHVSAFVCAYVCMCMCVSACVYLCVPVCICVSVYMCACLCQCVCMDVECMVLPVHREARRKHWVLASQSLSVCPIEIRSLLELGAHISAALETLLCQSQLCSFPQLLEKSPDPLHHPFPLSLLPFHSPVTVGPLEVVGCRSKNEG